MKTFYDPLPLRYIAHLNTFTVEPTIEQSIQIFFMDKMVLRITNYSRIANVVILILKKIEFRFVVSIKLIKYEL